MSQSIDLSNLKEEINNRKKNKGYPSTDTGVINESGPKDGFLNELLTSLKTGQRNESIERIKIIENAAAKKSGENVPDYQPKQNTQKPTQSQNNAPVGPSPDRDAALYEELERKQKEYFGKSHNQQPSQQILNGNSGGGINEAKLHESVMNIIGESAGIIVERALKDAVFDLFTEEKIKDVILENKKLIRGIVIETIRELQKKK